VVLPSRRRRMLLRVSADAVGQPCVIQTCRASHAWMLMTEQQAGTCSQQSALLSTCDKASGVHCCVVCPSLLQQELYVDHNKLQTLPLSLTKLTNLRRLYVEDNPDLVLPEALKQLPGLAARDYEASASTPASAPPTATKAPVAGSSSSPPPPPRASFDQQPLSAVPPPDLSGLNLGAGVGGPPPLRLGPLGGGPPPLRAAASAAKAAAAAPAGHHHEFLTDPARTAEQQDK